MTAMTCATMVIKRAAKRSRPEASHAFRSALVPVRAGTASLHRAIVSLARLIGSVW